MTDKKNLLMEQAERKNRIAYPIKDETIKNTRRKKAMGGGVMDMTRMRYLKGGQV